MIWPGPRHDTEQRKWRTGEEGEEGSTEGENWMHYMQVSYRSSANCPSSHLAFY
jgi:hypothetical protein